MYSKYDATDNGTDYTDCFAYGRYKCAALTEMLCKTCGKCSFYMPQHIFYEKRKKVKERLEKIYDTDVQ